MFRGMLALVFAGVLSIGSAARAAPPPVEDYGKLPGVEDVSLSPSGERLAFIAVIGDTRSLVVTDIKFSPLYATNVGNAKVRGLRWAGDDHVLVEMSDAIDLGPGFTTSKAELTSVVVINPVAHKAFSVFAHEETVAKDVFGGYSATSIDGHWYGYFATVTLERSGDGISYYYRHNYPDLYRVDLDTGAIVLAAHGSDDIAC